MTMICMVALLVTAMSCKKEKVENTAVGAGFRATLEAHAGDSKTHLDGLSVKWDLGDAVTVVNAVNDAKRFVISAIHDDYSDLVPAEGEGVTEAFYKPNYKAYYPAAIYDAGQVSLPQTQDYAAGSFGKGFNPMAAYAVNKNLDFKNLCGLLALQLTGDCEVKSITITSKNDEMLWGKGELTLSSSAATLGTLTEGGSSITLNCYVDNEYVQLSGTATTFYFVVPDGALAGGFDVLLTDSDDKVWRRSASQNTTINQNKIRTMPEQAVATTKPIEFTVDADGTTVEFAPGNLYYDGSSWKFESNQYDYRTYAGKNSCIGGSVTTDGTPSDHWGMFGWSTSSTTYGMSTSENNSTYSGDFKDWGTAPGLPGAGEGKSWRTLSKDEWTYLMNTSGASSGARTDANRFAKAMVNGVVGLLIFPDGYTGTASGDGIATVNSTGAAYPDSNIPDATWTSMESAGVVFLPAAGYRSGTSDSYVGSHGFYWSSSYNLSFSYYACYLCFYSGGVDSNDDGNRYLGFTVRLVSEN